MSLVGDAIVEAREAFPDPAQFLPPPSTAAGWTISAIAGGALGTSTYFIVVTALNPWGETSPMAEASIATSGGNNTISVVPPASLIPGVTGFRVYISTTGLGAGGQVIYFQSVPGSVQTMNVTSLTVPPSTGFGPIQGIPPTRNSAMLPDTDGSFVSASTMYRWLNDGLQAMGRIAGGIPSITGIKAVAGQAMYTISGRWIRFTNYWFDGWPLSAGKRGDVFLHNTVMGIPGIVTIEEWSDTTVVQCWPQPNRTGAATTTSGTLLSTTVNPLVVSTSGFLALGLASISGSDLSSGLPATEIVAYSAIDATHLLSCTRGLSGTVPISFVAGATVSELNLRIAGFRQPVLYSIGQATANLPLPLGWEVPLSNYIVAQYRRAEQQEEQAQAMEKAFSADIMALAKLFRGKTGPIQIGSITREVYPGGYSGGILLQ